jgi:hypothetical protein
MAKRRNPITGQWSARPIEMQRSYAWRVLSRAAHQCLSRIEIELADHGGNDIGELPVTFDDFVAYGVHRSAIAPALAELEALGFIDITQRGVAARAADSRRPNKFRLLTRPWENIGATFRPRWDRFKTLKDAVAAADEARRSAVKEKSASTETVPKKVRNPYQRRENASTETVPQASVGNRTTIYISEGGVSSADADALPEASLTTVAVRNCDGTGFNPPTPFRCRRPGAQSFVRWGSVYPDCAPAKRPRQAGALTQARWRTAVDTASNFQEPIFIGALPPNEALLSNAQHEASARLTVDVLTPLAPTFSLVL